MFGKQQVSKNSAVVLPPDNVLKRAEAIISSVLDVDSCERRRQCDNPDGGSEHNTHAPQRQQRRETGPGYGYETHFIVRTLVRVVCSSHRYTH